MEKQSLVTLLDLGLSVEKIAKRFGKDPSTVSYWMAKYGLEAPNRDKHAAKGGIERERLEGLVEAGMTVAEIAANVGLSREPSVTGYSNSGSRRREPTGDRAPRRGLGGSRASVPRTAGPSS